MGIVVVVWVVVTVDGCPNPVLNAGICGMVGLALPLIFGKPFAQFKTDIAVLTTGITISFAGTSPIRLFKSTRYGLFPIPSSPLLTCATGNVEFESPGIAKLETNGDGLVCVILVCCVVFHAANILPLWASVASWGTATVAGGDTPPHIVFGLASAEFKAFIFIP